MNLLIVLCHHTLILQLGAAHSFNKKSVDKHFSLQLLQFFFSFCRFGAPSVQRGAANGGRFIIKQQRREVKPVSKQRPQTLDSLFANMKEQRMKMHSQQNNAPRRNGGGQQIVPWARGRFGK